MLDLHLLREEATDKATVGKLFISNTFQWWTLEDVLRPLGDKIQGETCIPAGRYRVILTESARFKRTLPLLLNVPGFTGIRIHPGNTTQDTAGCILLGGGYLPATITLVHSRPACDSVQMQIQRAIEQDDKVWITIEDPVAPLLPKGKLA